jgi:hypothetical protein
MVAAIVETWGATLCRIDDMHAPGAARCGSCQRAARWLHEPSVAQPLLWVCCGRSHIGGVHEWSGRGTGRQSQLRHCHVAADRLRGVYQRCDKFAADLRGTVASSLGGYVDRGQHIA